MNTGSKRSVRQTSRRRQAREWFVMSGPHSELSPALKQKWDRWASDPRNVAEFKEYERIDRVLRSLPRRPLPTDAELHARWPKATSFLWRVACFTAVSAVLALAVGIALLRTRISSMLQPPPPHERMLHTARTQQLSISLRDGSVIRLGGDSRLSYLVSEKVRHVTFYNGEAFFTVTHNPRVPFEVDVGETSIKDLGTVFHVRRYSDDRQVIVDVAEGSVSVAPREREVADARLPVTVLAGQQVSSDAAGRITPAHPADFQAMAWWLYGRRVYREKPLGKVIEDVQLYFPKHIEYDRPLRLFPFTGIIDPNKTEEWVHGLKEILPVEIDESDPQRVVIHCRQVDCQPR
jgi:transmembrane sensor